jgi:hypothetical protein
VGKTPLALALAAQRASKSNREMTALHYMAIARALLNKEKAHVQIENECRFLTLKRAHPIKEVLFSLSCALNIGGANAQEHTQNL